MDKGRATAVEGGISYLGYWMIDKGTYWKITKGQKRYSGAGNYQPASNRDTLQEAMEYAEKGGRAQGPIPYDHSVVEPGDEIV